MLKRKEGGEGQDRVTREGREGISHLVLPCLYTGTGWPGRQGQGERVGRWGGACSFPLWQWGYSIGDKMNIGSFPEQMRLPCTCHSPLTAQRRRDLPSCLPLPVPASVKASSPMRKGGADGGPISAVMQPEFELRGRLRTTSEGPYCRPRSTAHLWYHASPPLICCARRAGAFEVD